MDLTQQESGTIMPSGTVMRIVTLSSYYCTGANSDAYTQYRNMCNFFFAALKYTKNIYNGTHFHHTLIQTKIQLFFQ